MNVAPAIQGERSRALRAIPAGQKMNIWLELEAAEAYGNVNTDVFQVLSFALHAADGMVLV